MKTIVFFSIFFSAVALPVFSELTPQDLDKIRLIINDSEKRIKAEIKQELKAEMPPSEQNIDKIRLIINDSEKRIKAEIKGDLKVVEEELRAEIISSRQNLKEYIDIKIDGVERRLSMYNWVLYVLMPLIVAAIGIPTAIMAWRSGRDRSLEKQVETLTQEMEILKQQRIVKP